MVADLRDLLVPLYGLPPVPRPPDGTLVDRPAACSAPRLLDAVAESFGRGWEAEARVCVSRTPATAVAAFEEASGAPMGFCCWDAAALGFLGPVGVFQTHRGLGLGRCLVLSCLHAMRAQGYGYAIVGGAGPDGFFASVCDARPIEGSGLSVYPPWLGSSGS